MLPVDPGGLRDLRAIADIPPAHRVTFFVSLSAPSAPVQSEGHRLETLRRDIPDFSEHPVTRVLEAAVGGDRRAVDRLLTLVYDELREIARARLAGLAPGQSLRPTDLVHEAYIKLIGVEDRTWENRRHFINAAGTAMRSIIVDRARARMALKRGGDREHKPLHDDAAVFSRDPSEVLAMNEALRAFAEEDDRAAKVVSLRIFLGMAEADIADVLGVTDRTVQRDWKYARAWLAIRMRSDDHASGTITG